MRKIILSVLFYVSVFQLFSQGSYFKVKSDYGMSLSRHDSGNDTETKAGEYLNKSKLYNGAGNGWNTGIGYGYMIGRHVGIELSGEYHIGASRITERVSEDHINETFDSETKIVDRRIHILPAVVFSTGCGAVEFYSRIGLLLPVYSRSYIQRDALRFNY